MRMRYDVILSDRAEEDLRGIYAHLAYEAATPEKAAEQLGDLERFIAALGVIHEYNRPLDREPWRSRGIRAASEERFVVLYITDEDSRTVKIVRVMPGGKDMETWMRKSSLLSMPISELSLPVRLFNCLMKSGMRTVGDVIGHSRADLAGIKGFGKTQLEDLLSRLRELGLKLSDE